MKIKLFLISIFLVSFFIRIYKVNNYPSFLWDEAAIGYNAYSILETGKDEYGKLFPLIFKSFGDYKPGLYVYLAIPFIKFFGLNELSTRLPSVLIGSLIPVFLYFLIKEIDSKSNKLAIIAAILAVFNPYNIHFSRGSWETNILTAELILASFFFFRALKNNRYVTFLLSALIFASTLYTYQAGKLISLLLIIILFATNYQIILSKVKKILVSFIFPLALLSLPLALGLLFNKDSNRLKIVSLFSYPRNQSETQTIISETGSFDYDIFHNDFLFFSKEFLIRYFNHFSPRFLAFEGDWQNPRHSAPYIGVLLYPSLLFLIIGLFSGKINRFFLLWLLVSPIPASLTRDSVQAVRSMSFSIPLIYFSALGIVIFLNKFSSFFAYSLLFFMYFFSFFYFSDLYLNHLVKKSPNDFLYGYKEAVQYLVANQNNFEKFSFTDFYGQPYIFYLFYSKYPPTKYQKQAKLSENLVGDTGKVEKIDNIQFTSTSYDYIKSSPNTLGIFSHDEILRQGIDKMPEFNQFVPLSPINNISTFYAYHN